MLWACVAALAASGITSAAPLGFTFVAEGWVPPYASSLSSDPARNSLTALTATGVQLVKLTLTAYVDDETSTVVHNASGTPLASASLEEVDDFLSFASSLNLSVLLAPLVDINWALKENLNREAWYATNSIGRSNIGSGFGANNNTAWDDLFQAYSSWILPLAQLAQKHSPSQKASAAASCAAGALPSIAGVVGFAVADSIDAMFAQESRMRSLIASVRGVYSGCLTATATGSTINSIAWWDAVDIIGHAAFWPVGDSPVNIGQAPAVESMTEAWTPILTTLSNVSSSHGNKRILITSVGFQSRPNCHLRPWGTGAPGENDANYQSDPSAWPLSYDVACQANAITALLNVFPTQPWWAGTIIHRWSADDTAGGTSDNSWTPHGKQAEAIIRNYTGASHDSDVDGSASIVKAMRRSMAALGRSGVADTAAPSSNAPYTGFRGFLFGGPDEWSSPSYRLDSAGAQQSLMNMISLGATAVEVAPMWFFANVTATDAYPITDPSSPLRTSTDAELLNFIAFAKGKGLRVVVSPMVDPDYTLSAQFGCHNAQCRKRSLSAEAEDGSDGGSVDGPQRPGCFWRGQVGYFWPDAPGDCSNVTGWSDWHVWYSTFILHYATLSQQAGADGLIISHELDRPVINCATQWASLLESVRGVFSGDVTITVPGSVLSMAPPPAWMGDLDWLGYECYLGSYAPTPASGLPFDDASQEDMNAGAVKVVNDTLGKLSSIYNGKQVACTEVGWMSAPWAAEVGWANMFDYSNQDVSMLDQWAVSQAMAYTAFLQAVEPLPYYRGTLGFWVWRADPTAGGHSDVSATPWGKDASVAIAKAWGGNLSALLELEGTVNRGTGHPGGNHK